MALQLKRNVIENYQAQTTKTKKHTILLVDDEQANLEGLAETLATDYNIIIANSGAIAVDIINALTPPEQIHLIIADQRMPEMTGVELFEQMVQIIPDSIRMILTGFADINAIIDSINRGSVYKFLTKPIDPREMQVTVQRALEVFELRQKNKTLVNELMALNTSLEQKIIERTAELAEKKQDLEKVNADLKQQIITVKQLSKLKEDIEKICQHDLKTPLTAIINIPHLLRLDHNLTARQIQYLDAIKESGHQMQNIINHSLSLYQMENDIYDFLPEKIDLIPILKKIISENESLIHSKKITINIEIDEQPLSGHNFFIIGESLLCYTLFGNLLKNALEASPAEKVISISLVKKTYDAIIKICNSGSVPEAIRENFFDKYVTANKKGGTGLGTYSAYLSVIIQQGTIELDTSEACMTSIIIKLPLAR